MATQCTGKEAFDTVYDANLEKVYKVAYYYSGNHHTAQDITQCVFMKLYTNIENVNMKNVEAWLKTTAKHMALNEVTKYGRNKLEKPSGDMADEMDNVIYLADEYGNEVPYEVAMEYIDILKQSVKEIKLRGY